MLKLLQNFEDLFNGTLNTWKIYPVDLELKEYVKPICSRPYPVPKVHDKIFKNEVESLVLIGVLELANDPERGYPSFTQSKPKSNIVHL